MGPLAAGGITEHTSFAPPGAKLEITKDFTFEISQSENSVASGEKYWCPRPDEPLSRLSKPFSEIEASIHGRLSGVSHYVHPEIGFCERGEGRMSRVDRKLPRMLSPLLIF